jgi:hypothetical protein
VDRERILAELDARDAGEVFAEQANPFRDGFPGLLARPHVDRDVAIWHAAHAATRPSAWGEPDLVPAATSANGSWVVTWSIRWMPDPIEDRIVVSDSGDVWSPKIAPASTAPSIGTSRAAHVPHEVATTLLAGLGWVDPGPWDEPVQAVEEADDAVAVTGQALRSQRLG